MPRFAAPFVVLALLSTIAAAGSHEDYDIRDDAAKADVIERHREKADKEKIKEKKEKMARAAERVEGEVPGLAVAFSARTGAPETIGVARGRRKLTGKSSEPREQIARAFLHRNADLFGLAPSEVARLRKIADYTNPSGNLGWVELKQELNGLPVFQGEIRFAVSAEGELVQGTGNLVPALEDASIETTPSVSAAAAVEIAAEAIGVETSSFTRDVEPALEYFPLDGGVVTLAWSMILWQEDAAFYTYVSAEDGEVLWRMNLVHEQTQPATYVVYDSDSPAPLSPTNATPGSGIQGALIPRTSFTIISENAFNNLGWMNDGTSITTGNNVDAGLDLAAPDGIDLGTRATGTAFRVFDYAYNPPPGNPPPGDEPSLAAFRFGEVVQMFFWANRHHDRLYELGFTESARNYQRDNFGRGGLGNDPMIVEGQDFLTVNNASFAAAPDGVSGRVQMYLFTGPDPDRSAGLDQEALLHELTHGTSLRLHANISGLNAGMSNGMGEGWSDFYARALLSGPDEDVNGVYAYGAYVMLGRLPGYTDNYYYGIRRFPYAVIRNVGANGKPHNPLTFADIDPAQLDLTDGAYPRGPNGSTNAFEVHAIGEVWCSALLEVRAHLINRLGWAAGNQLALQLVTDGMKLDPATPTFIQGRNAILAANFGSINASAATEADIWRGFAARGVGLTASAAGPNSSSVVESFDVPNAVPGNVTIVSDDCDNNHIADPGETVVLSIPFTNPYQLNDINDAVVTVGATTIALGPIAPGQTVTRTFSVTIPSTASCGVRYPLPVTVVSSFGTLTRTPLLQIGIPTAQLFAGTFSSGNVNTPIVDNATVEVPIVVTASGLVGSASVAVRLNHAFDGELVISLVAPDGTVVPLANRRGAAGDNFGSGANDCTGTPTGFADFAGPSISTGTAPFGGTFRPESPLFAVSGHEMNGTWKLRVADIGPGNVGVIGCVSLDLSRQLNFCCGVAGTPLIFAAGPATLAAECAASTNGAPDPGELVTMNFPLVNGGEGATTNLTATLLGVTQSYGVLAPLAPPVTRAFQFAIPSTVACGGDFIATLALSDNGVDLGTVSFNIRTGQSVTTSSTFSNTAPIQIPAAGTGAPTGAPSNPYPSPITVSGVTGMLAGVALTIHGFSHTAPADVDLLLVGPGGQRFIAMSDLGGLTDAVNLTITLDDAAPAALPSVLTSGTFRPGNSLTGDAFPSPAPAPPYQSPITAGGANFTSVFANTTPNGTWRLFVVDDNGGTDIGSIAGGWTLTLRTTTRVCATVPAPDITSVTADPATLWPPNHQMVDVDVDYDTDCATCTLSVTSNEPENDTGDGNTAPDFEVVDAHRVRLRAERAGSGNGRVYTITITCANGAGTTVRTVGVEVRAP
ncbi:MAG TPA: M36 family metallopeptidase [Thermoanaerobaculia bacterium]|nr:M36 family metallopeptidase [Thermoanaerobaculia bacterium]